MEISIRDAVKSIKKNKKDSEHGVEKLKTDNTVKKISELNINMDIEMEDDLYNNIMSTLEFNNVDYDDKYIYFSRSGVITGRILSLFENDFDIKSITYDRDKDGNLKPVLEDSLGIITYKSCKILLKRDIDGYQTTFIFVADKKEDVDELLKEALKGKTKPKEFLKPGVYQLKETQMGMVPEMIFIDKKNKPVLNNDLHANIQEEIDLFLAKEDFYSKQGMAYKRGILLHGPPGNGKTSFIKNLEVDDSITLILDINKSGHIDFMQSILTDEDYRECLKIIVIEDIDGFNGTGRSKFLNLLDGITDIKKTIFIATTNYPEKIDKAIASRPSRFDSLYEVALPEEGTRLKILENYFGQEWDKEDLKIAAKKSKGMSGAFLKELRILSEYYNLTAEAACVKLDVKFKEFKDVMNLDYMG